MARDSATAEAATQTKFVLAVEAPVDVELLNYVEETLREEETFHYRGFEFLHRWNIVRIQNDLIEMKENIYHTRGTNVDKEKLNKLLDDYTNALRNYNYVHSAPRLDSETAGIRKQRLKRNFSSITTSYRHTKPFESHYYFLHDNANHPEPDFLRDKLRHGLPPWLSYSLEERQRRRQEFEDGKPPAEVSPLVDNIVRLAVALVAVVVLVAPMCIMVLNPSPVKSLVTSAVSMVIFACALSFAIKTSNIDVLVATATYSAVLVVFVGTSSSPSSNS